MNTHTRSSFLPSLLCNGGASPPVWSSVHSVEEVSSFFLLPGLIVSPTNKLLLRSRLTQGLLMLSHHSGPLASKFPCLSLPWKYKVSEERSHANQFILYPQFLPLSFEHRSPLKTICRMNTAWMDIKKNFWDNLMKRLWLWLAWPYHLF